MNNNDLERLRRGKDLPPLSDNSKNKQDDQSFYDIYWWIPMAISTTSIIISLITILR